MLEIENIDEFLGDPESFAVLKANLANKDLNFSTVVLSAESKKEYSLVQINNLLQILPKSIQHIDFTGIIIKDYDIKQFLSLLPANFKTAKITDYDLIDLDNYWIENPASTIVREGLELEQALIYRNRIIADRLIYQLNTQANIDKSDDLPLLKTLKEMFKPVFARSTDKTPQIKSLETFWCNLLLALLRNSLASALIHEPLWKSYDKPAAEAIGALKAVKLFEDCFSKAQSQSVKDYCLKKISVLAERYASYPVLALHVARNENLDYKLDEAVVLAQLKEEVSRLIESYKVCNLTYRFNLFSRHGAAGRERAVELNTMLSKTDSVLNFSKSLINFLADPAHGNYNEHSLRTVVLKGLSSYLQVASAPTMNRTEFDRELKKLAKQLSSKDELIQLPIPKVESSGWCSFAG